MTAAQKLEKLKATFAEVFPEAVAQPPQMARDGDFTPTARYYRNQGVAMRLIEIAMDESFPPPREFPKDFME